MLKEYNFKPQQHLKYKETINLGSYYTKPKLVKIVYDLLQRNVSNFSEYTILDTSCGYGSFLDYNIPNKKIGADIDEIALNNVKSPATLIGHNSLLKINRQDYGLINEKLIIVGNPPYNDTTSIIRNKMKQEQQIDNSIKTRDLGMSFLLSYNKLNADFVCVLHPLSYLIKKTNFLTINDFAKNYKLIDCEIISSQEFTIKISSTFFPIIIALYKKGEGMDYNFIQNYNFKVKNKTFRLSNMVSIANFVTKYPNKLNDYVAKFYTMRDINALKRSQTFMKETTYNTIFVSKEKLPYYIYVDCFKKYAIEHVPYYFGNCDVFIDYDKFKKNKEA
ncbi:MAG: SAM-dependent methyltransferase, partial [Elusimicrobiota bacterium]|nr:SAM-dependent methyltransferase [Elusimicrobiota bacterium]